MGINFSNSRFLPLNVVNFSSMTPTAASNSALMHEISLTLWCFLYKTCTPCLSLEKLAYFIRRRIFPKELGCLIGFYHWILGQHIGFKLFGNFFGKFSYFEQLFHSEQFLHVVSFNFQNSELLLVLKLALLPYFTMSW